MSEPDTPPPTQDQLMQEAAAWFARMRGPEAEASRGEFEAWLRRGALHRRAYNRASEIFAMGKLLAEEEPPAQESGHRSRRRVLPALAGLVALVAAGGLALHLAAPGHGPDSGVPPIASSQPPGVERLASGPDERRIVRLADGSRVMLTGSTIVEARFGPSERRFELKQGRARFEVVHERRPFVVHAGGGVVTARGTVFDVALSPERRVTVRLVEGSVDVTLPAPATPGQGAAVRRLHPGETMSFAPEPNDRPKAGRPRARLSGGTAPAPAAAEARAQPEAVRDFEAVAVADLVAEANRGSRRPIRLADPAIAGRRVSGRFRIDDTALLAERLALLFELGMDIDDPGEIVLRRQ